MVGLDKYGNTFNIGGVSAPYMGGVSEPLEETYDPGYISSLIRAGETPYSFPRYLTQGIVQPYTAQPVQPAFDGSGMFRTPQTGTNMPVMPTAPQTGTNMPVMPFAPQIGNDIGSSFGGSYVPQTSSGGLGGFLSSNANNLFNLGANYYVGREGEKAFSTLGREARQGAEAIGQRAVEQSQFRPYSVTSSLANIQTTPEGGFGIQLSPQEQAQQARLQSLSGAAAGSIGAGYDPRAGQIGGAAYGQAQQQLGQVGTIDPSLAAQRGAVGGLFGQTLGQMGQPTGFEGITQAGLGGAQAQLGRAGQPADIEALRSQYAGLAGAAGQGLLTSPEARQADIYEAIRATQAPEEERQRLATEERLLSQGRLGLSSAAYGGASPELLAQETARQEAMARAGLSARQQALAEQQQEMATATGLTGLASNLAGLSSDLETAGIGRGTALAGLGLQGAQAGRGFEQQDLANLLQLQQADIGAAAQQQALQQGRLGLGAGLFGLGTQAAQLPSQLQAADIANMQQLMAAGYLPQQQALSLLEASQIPAGFADIGRRTGASLQSQTGQLGLEGYLQAAELGQTERLANLQSMANIVGGSGTGASAQQGLLNSAINSIFGTKQPTASINNIGSYLGGLFSGGSSTSTGSLLGGGSNATGGFMTNDLFGGMSSGSGSEDRNNNGILDIFEPGVG